MLTRDQILGVSDASVVPVEVPEWSGVVYVRTMSGADRDEFETAAVAMRKAGSLKGQARALFVAFVACDEAGARLFSLDDLDALGKKRADVLDRIAAAGIRLNRLTDAEVEDEAKKS